MPDDAKTLLRTGQITQGAYNKILAGTKVQPSKMAQFDGRKKDEGGRTDRGHTGVASTRHIDQNQAIAPPPLKGNRIAGRPSRGTGARAAMPKNGRSFDKTGGSVPDPGATQPRSAEINQGGLQRPKFPASTNVRAGNANLGGASSKKAKGRIAKRGGQYGGGGQNTQ